MTVPGVRSLKNGGHAFVHGKMKIPPLLQGQLVSAPCCPEWQVGTLALSHMLG